MKNYIGIAALVVFILGAAFLLSAATLGMDIHIRDHYFVLSLRIAVFFFLLLVAAIWFLILLIRRVTRQKRV